VGGAILAPLTLPVLPPETERRYEAALGLNTASGENHEMGELPQHFADMFGWEELARAVSDVYRALPPEERATARVFAHNYGEAGALEFYRGTYDLPPVICPHNSYWYWGPGPDGGTMILVGGKLEDHEQALEHVTEVARFAPRWNMPYERNLPIFVGRGWKVSLRENWVREKRFI
jgi:hypothetical protein